MGKLNYWEAYKLMFCFLDKYWEQYPDYELALLLGSMSPYTFAGEIPMDDKIVLDWVRCN